MRKPRRRRYPFRRAIDLLRSIYVSNAPKYLPRQKLLKCMDTQYHGTFLATKPHIRTTGRRRLLRPCSTAAFHTTTAPTAVAPYTASVLTKTIPAFAATTATATAPASACPNGSPSDNEQFRTKCGCASRYVRSSTLRLRCR